MEPKTELEDVSPEWMTFKEKGNKLYGSGKHAQAVELYTKAICFLENNNNDPNYSSDLSSNAESLFPKDVCNDLAKLYSNRALCVYQLASSAAKKEKDKKLEEALKDGETAVSYNKNFDKGHFRCAICLCAMGRPDDAIPYAKSILALYKSCGKDFEDDNHILKLLDDCGFYNVSLQKSETWEKVKFKDNFKIVGAKTKSATHSKNLDPDLIAGETKITLIVKPGRYHLTRGFIVRKDQEVQVIGDTKREKDTVVIECSGSVFHYSACHLFQLSGGKVYLDNVTLRQASDNPEAHAVFADFASEAYLEGCKCYSKCSGCIAANGASRLTLRNCKFDKACGGVIAVGSSYATIENCTFINISQIGIESRDGGFTTVHDTQITGCGSQAITAHAGAGGFSVERCTVINNCKNFHGQEASVNCASGVSMISECNFRENKGGGIMVQECGYCLVKDTKIEGGRVGLGASMKGEAHLKNCTVTRTTFGVCIAFNQKGKVVLENNEIKDCKFELMVSPDDDPPKMIGKQYAIMSKPDSACDGMRTGLMMEKMSRLGDHFGLAMPWMDPRMFCATKERICSPCGLSQRAKGIRFMMCSKCKIVWYCSKECQQKDWKLHKEICQKMASIMKDRP